MFEERTHRSPNHKLRFVGSHVSRIKCPNFIFISCSFNLICMPLKSTPTDCKVLHDMLVGWVETDNECGPHGFKRMNNLWLKIHN